MTKRKPPTHEEMKQYVEYYVDKKYNKILRHIDSVEMKAKTMVEANAEMIRDNAIRIRTRGK